MRRRTVVGVLMATTLAGTIGWGAPALLAQGVRPPLSVAQAPPFELKDGAVVAEGARLFQQNCTGYCHGKEGRVARAPKLRGRQYEPGYLYGRIVYGQPPMPAYGTVMTPEQIWKLVAYIASLADKED